tara:strand:- start:8054 stop:9025 length:972 start_codon:yes stop_codon:yes gene_type:complete
MIITRSPFRITLAGGGTDLPAYYNKYGGEVTSMAINKYIFVSFKRNLLINSVRLQYLKTEVVNSVNNLSHERARAVLKEFNVLDRCEISSMADLPAQSGLGSSGSYLVALINCLKEYRKINMSKFDIANLACRIEMEDLQEPVGKQDQFISSYGGIKKFSINKSGVVEVSGLNLSADDIDIFTKRCAIYYTGTQRHASTILKSQTKDKDNFENQMRKIHNLANKFVNALETKNFDNYGHLLDEHWTYKKKLSNKMTYPTIEKIYDNLKREKLILGGKLIGAGGGGFFMVYVPKEFEKVDNYMYENKMMKIDYSIDVGGVKTIY